MQGIHVEDTDAVSLGDSEKTRCCLLCYNEVPDSHKQLVCTVLLPAGRVELTTPSLSAGFVFICICWMHTLFSICSPNAGFCLLYCPLLHSFVFFLVLNLFLDAALSSIYFWMHVMFSDCFVGCREVVRWDAATLQPVTNLRLPAIAT